MKITNYQLQILQDHIHGEIKKETTKKIEACKKTVKFKNAVERKLKPYEPLFPLFKKKMIDGVFFINDSYRSRSWEGLISKFEETVLAELYPSLSPNTIALKKREIDQYIKLHSIEAKNIDELTENVKKQFL